MTVPSAPYGAEAPARVLVVEDVPWDFELMRHEFSRSGLHCVIRRVEAEVEFRQALDEFTPDVILTDYSLPRFSGMRVLHIVRELNLDTPVILVSGAVTEDVAAESLRSGAADYLLKDNLRRLGPSVEAVLESVRLQRQRTAAEGERAALERRLFAFAESSADAMIVIDPEGRVRFWNHAATSIFGFSAAEIMQESIHAIVPERFRASHEASVKALAEGDPVVNRGPIRTSSLHRNGHEIPIELTLGSWTEGERTWISAVVRDVTERVATEERLQAVQDHYRAILENLPVVTYESGLGEDGAMLWLAPQIEDLLGTPAAQWAQDRSLFLERTHPEDRDRVTEAMSKGHDSGSMDIEYRMCHEDGRYLWLRDRAVVGPSVSNDGSRVFRGVIQDVTQAKDSERRRALLSSAVEQSSSLMVITDTEGNLEYANPAFETITGYSLEESVGRNLRFLKTDQHPDAFFDELWADLDAGRSWTREFVNRRKDGTSYHQRSTIFPMQDEDGRTRNYVGIGQDVTNEVALEKQLRQAQKMEAVGQLTGGIAHDLNNVLAAILTNAQVLAMAQPSDSVREESGVRDIERAARRGADLIKRLMAFSRDEHLVLEVVDPSELLEETVELLKRVLPENIELILEEAHEGALVRVDRGGMQQALLNFATNARDAMPDGGTLAISTAVAGSRTKRGGWQGDARVEISVRDSGVGMDAETLQRAFDPFFTTKERDRGTGLGLAMVHQLVGRLEGTVDVESEPGVGTTFTIALPVTVSDARRQPEERLDLPILAPPACEQTLLLVEDEALLRRAGRRALEQVGYRVLVAANGSSALEILLENRSEISLVVTDLIMPQGGGVELCEATRDWQPRPAFLITSGHGASEMSGRILGHGATFLRKPWGARDLVMAVGDALNDETPANPAAV